MDHLDVQLDNYGQQDSRDRLLISELNAYRLR